MKKKTCKEDAAGPTPVSYPIPVYRLQLVQDGTADASPVARTGAMLGIRLLDHVVLAPDSSHFSYRDRRPECMEG